MSAQIHFAAGREPAQIEMSILPDEECSLCKIVFRGNRLKSFFRQPGI